MANKYYLHQGVTVSCAFAVKGVATDPTTVTLRIIDPAGAEFVYTYALSQITKDSTGKYSKIISSDLEGTWFYEWVGTGACIAGSQNYYQIVTYMG